MREPIVLELQYPELVADHLELMLELGAPRQHCAEGYWLAAGILG